MACLTSCPLQMHFLRRSLGFNKVGDAGAIALAAVLPRCRAIMKIKYVVLLPLRSILATAVVASLSESRGRERASNRLHAKKLTCVNFMHDVGLQPHVQQCRRGRRKRT